MSQRHMLQLDRNSPEQSGFQQLSLDGNHNMPPKAEHFLLFPNAIDPDIF